MPIIGLAFIIQLAFAIHVVKSGRKMYWIYIIIFIPGIGAAIYFFSQILPDLGQSRTIHTAKNSLLKAVDPQRELREKKERLAIANTLDNKLKLAEECYQANMLDDSIELFQSCLTGIGEGNPDIMVKLSQAYFAREDYQLTIDTLDETTEKNPTYNSTHAHLIYVRSLEKLNKTQQALSEYKVVSENFPGEEGRVRYALLLIKEQQYEKAKKVLDQSINRSKLAPKFYQKKENQWIKIAKSQLKELNGKIN